MRIRNRELVRKGGEEKKNDRSKRGRRYRSIEGGREEMRIRNREMVRKGGEEKENGRSKRGRRYRRREGEA
jgi:hypothetical protein